MFSFQFLGISFNETYFFQHFEVFSSFSFFFFVKLCGWFNDNILCLFAFNVIIKNKKNDNNRILLTPMEWGNNLDFLICKIQNTDCYYSYGQTLSAVTDTSYLQDTVSVIVVSLQKLITNQQNELRNHCFYLNFKTGGKRSEYHEKDNQIDGWMDGGTQ